MGEEVAGLYVEGVGYLERGFDGEVLPAVFYQADVGAFQAGNWCIAFGVYQLSLNCVNCENFH